ncbi:LRR receptor-like serine/threonine-protein kinase EFR [Cryptomeria japonica]|uniref:LRR receptor-like serine/threonine-protein kinase EFR n=1 Tax=Cryptomeria japonica TaxID=3369 RepID=UPI0027DA801E|nr:LRR receptor-like serine/threonine-protein kinase EFR [Cryptomeria japonica]
MKMKLACLLFFFMFVLPLSLSSPSNHSDEEALLAFKRSLSSDPQNFLLNWSPQHSFCNWTGVFCASRHQRVFSLNLTGMSLLGPISPFLGNLSFLRVLDLKANNFQGHIPPQLGRLFRLRILKLSRNRLEGSIPSALAGCHSLQQLILTFNHLTGSIPSDLGLLSHLENLWLGANQLTGTIPPSLGNISSLTFMDLGENKLHGGIPMELGDLTQLTILALDNNNLRGVITLALFNCTLLQNLSLYDNELSGNIPSEFGKLSVFQSLLLTRNQLTGEIPTSLFNCTQLYVLDLSYNHLIGKPPLEFGNLHQLQKLSLGVNHLVSGSNDLSLLTVLTNCSSLKNLELSFNYFTGILPSSISHLSSQLSVFHLSSNKIEGSIPIGISNLTMMEYLDLSDNHFNGTIPSSLSQLPRLERLYLEKNILYGSIPKELGQAKHVGVLSLSRNKLSGKIANSLGNLLQLRNLYLDHNQLSGKIPASLGRCRNLELIDLSHNKLRGNISPEIAGLQNLLFYFNISNNFLQGSLLEMSKMVMVQAIDVSVNNFSGEIPAALSSCKNLQYLNLSWNSFYGPIPASLTQLKNLEDIDLSSNKLTGEVPKGGVFAKINESSLMGNPSLCGKWINLQACSNSKQSHFSTSKKLIVPIVIGIAIFIISIAILIIFYKRRNQNTFDLNIWPRRILYEELEDATNRFNETNLLGVGSFGSVYKGILNNGTNIAVKVLNLQDENALKSFYKECNVLKRVRHRNVIKIISACSNPNFKALILPLMSNGSLEKWLYPEGVDDCRLNFSNRLQIAKEIAQGIAYLHHHCFVQVIHCDLKPNNVLFEHDMTPYIADFGITRLLFGTSIDSLTSTNALKGSIGYIAPEYGMGGNISTKGDVYSYGILLLEMLTRRKPTDDIFVEGMNLPKWVGIDFPNRITEVVDNSMLRDVNEPSLSMVLSCLTQCMQVGLACTRELPQQRPNMMEIANRLEDIERTFLGTRSFQLPMDISPFLETQSGLRNSRDENWSTSSS